MEDNRMICLNIGSGRDYRKSNDKQKWVNLDPNPEMDANIVARVEDMSMIEDNTVDFAQMIHVWEHCDDLIKPMEEIWRVCKPGAEVQIVSPHWTHHWAISDPTHKRVISEHTFVFFNYPSYEANAKARTPMSQLRPKCDFDIMKISLTRVKPDETFKDFAFAAKHYLEVIQDVTAIMKVVKPIRTFDLKKYMEVEEAAVR